MMGLEEIWDQGYDGDGMVIAVLDSGMRVTHDAFADYGLAQSPALSRADVVAFSRKGGTKGAYLSARIPFAYDYFGRDTDVSTIDDHGSHVAALAAGYVPEAQGACRGAAPAAQILSMKVFPDGTVGGADDAVILRALEDAWNLGADVVNLSLGTPNGYTQDDVLDGLYCQAFAQMRRTVGEMNADLESSIAGIRVSRAFTGEEHESGRFEHANQTYRQSREYGYRAMGEYYTLLYLLTDLLYWATLAGAAVFTFYGSITPGMLVQYILYVSLFMNSTKRLVDFAEMYEMGMTGFARFLEILDCDSERELPGAPALPPVRGEIAFQNVSFSYEGEGEEDGKAVLRHLNLTVEAGQKVAVVGPSGSGKTTLCHLVPRFYDTTEGQILVDGRDITQVSLPSLRRQVGIVQQDVFLFPGSFRENIAYGRFDATPEEIEDAARRANIHDFILTQPQGYETLVGERGVRLSGGQKQRIAIARVFLKNPAILILDEATSALDNTTELLIQEALDELCKGRTTLVVAHRLSTIKGADKIVVLTEEGIQEEGTHQQLLERDGLYTRLYNSQFAAQG